MTLGDFFNSVSNQPGIMVFYFLAIPLIAVLCYLWGRGEGHKRPWCIIYSFLIYMVCIPGIFAITLNLYLWFFEGQSLLESALFIQILPVISMIATLAIIRMNVDFKEIPGFGRMSTLLLIIGAVMSLLWLLEKTRIIAFTYLPFKYILFFLAAIFLIIIFGTKRVFKKG